MGDYLVFFIIALFILIAIILFFINKLDIKINKLKTISKKHHGINEVNTNSFGNIEKHISSFNQEIIDLNNQINIINKRINSMQNSEIESTENTVKSLRKKNFKEPLNIYKNEIKNPPVDLITETCNNHFKMSNREFRKKYSQDLKTIEISDDIEKEKPIFETSSTGKYIAVKYENEKYIVFYSKGTNITSESHSVSSIFIFTQKIEKAKIYENWQTKKPAIFFLNTDGSWIIEQKGIIKLDYNQEESKDIININTEIKNELSVISNDKHLLNENSNQKEPNDIIIIKNENLEKIVKEEISITIEESNDIININNENELPEITKEENLINENYHQKELNDINNINKEIKETINPITKICNNHFEFSNREFRKNYPNAIKLDITNSEDLIYEGIDPIFIESQEGKYIAISLTTINNSNYYLFYAKGTNITSEDVALKTIFNLDKELEIGKIYDEWKIIQPVILIIDFNNNWRIIKKGKIEL